MPRYYVITMNDGSEWGVPAEIIAKNRADYYAEIDPETTWREEYDAMMEWFDTKDYEFADWAKSNMDWDDVKDNAVVLGYAKKPPVDFQECWANGDYEYRNCDGGRKGEKT